MTIQDVGTDTRDQVSANCSDCDEPLEGNYFVSAYPPFSTWTADQVPAVHHWLSKPSTPSPDTPLGLYVHIPFCVRRCEYCYYLSHGGKSTGEMEGYVENLIQELAQYRVAPALAQRIMSFVYFGGGTPSMLPEELITRMLSGLQSCFSWNCVSEATFECAPRSATEGKLRRLREMGITRISLGVQELDDRVLRCNGRVHLVADVERAYEAIHRVGFDVVNVDLIVGLVGQTEESFLGSLSRILDMGPECVTIYQLEIPHNTPLFRRLREGDLEHPPVSWGAKRALLSRGFDSLEQAGYTLRSAYTAVKDPRRHRFDYQDAQYRGADLLGIGASAFSYLGGIHSQNISSLEEYEACIRERSFPIRRAYALTEEERLIREFVLQLKLGSADVEYFLKKYSQDILTLFAKPLARFQANGWLIVEDQAVRLTRHGLLRVDRLLGDFYLPRDRNVGQPQNRLTSA